MNETDRREAQLRSHLFTVRLWQEPMGDNTVESRMQVKHVLSGKTHYFRTWPALVDYLKQVVQEGGQAE